MLSVLTTLPWLTSILLTDIFAVIGVLGLWLLLMHADVLSRPERAGLVLLTAFSAATHSATLAVLGGLLIVAAVYARFDRKRLPPRRLTSGAIALALGVAMVFAGNYVIARQIAWTPGGFALSFGRMLQDGIVNKYLDAHCPDPYLRLCKYKDSCRATPTSSSGAARCSTSSDASLALTRRWSASRSAPSPNIRCCRSRAPRATRRSN